MKNKQYNKLYIWLSGNIITVDLSGNMNNQITNMINNRFDLWGNINSNINDVWGNLTDLINSVTDWSQDVLGIKTSNTSQDLKLIAHGAQIPANTDALVTLGGIVTASVATTGANTVLIDGAAPLGRSQGVLGACGGRVGIPGTVITPSTGIYITINLSGYVLYSVFDPSFNVLENEI